MHNKSVHLSQKKNWSTLMRSLPNYIKVESEAQRVILYERKCVRGWIRTKGSKYLCVNTLILRLPKIHFLSFSWNKPSKWRQLKQIYFYNIFSFFSQLFLFLLRRKLITAALCVWKMLIFIKCLTRMSCRADSSIPESFSSL